MVFGLDEEVTLSEVGRTALTAAFAVLAMRSSSRSQANWEYW